MKQEQNITIPLKLFVDSHLGRSSDGKNQMWNCRPINNDVGEIIIGLTNNEHTCYIQVADNISPHLTEPLLWDIGAWRRECDLHVREQLASNNRRIARFIFEANVKIVAKAFSIYTGCPLDHRAEASASLLLLRKKFTTIKIIGVSKLIEKESEL